MVVENTQHPRGSEWRQWDLHIHSPASFHWNGESFDPDPRSPLNTDLVDQMIEALNAAEPVAFALMDYWTFDGWFALQHRLSQPDAPKLEKTLFPGIELRLVSPMSARLNAHVIFSDKIENQVLRDFMSGLEVEVVKRPLSTEALIALARGVGEDKLKHHGHKKDKVDADDSEALLVGSKIAEINCESYKQSISKVPEDMAVGFMPFDTNDGLADINWQEHYAYCMGLFASSPIFETRNLDKWAAFVGKKTDGNSEWFNNFQNALENTPRLAVSGSDAHRFKGAKGSNDKRGYGDYPSEKITWIKADPTFRGLLQAIKEPEKRSFIGDAPHKLSEIDENKTYFIDSVEVQKNPSGNDVGDWLDGCKLPLNPDLVAIIGNKGSGKSALADVIALLGNSQQKAHFSFLKKDRFRGKSGEPAKSFDGFLTWCDSCEPKRRNLNEDPPEDKVELVRYIPQGHFEELCNTHVTRDSDAFEKELRAVIFSHADEEVRLGALDFDQLIERQESRFRDRLVVYREDIKKNNQDISGIEDQLQPQVKKSLEEQLIVKKRQIEEHKKLKLKEIPKPTEELTDEQKVVADRLEEISKILKKLAIQKTEDTKKGLENAKKLKAAENVRERMQLLDRAYSQFNSDTNEDLKLLGVDVKSISLFTLTYQPLDQIVEIISKAQNALRASIQSTIKEKTTLENEQMELNKNLNAPQLKYRQNLKAIQSWEAKNVELNGTPESPETLNGLKARKNQIDKLPEKLKTLKVQRVNLSKEIFDILNEQRQAREDLFAPVQVLIEKNSLIREEYKLLFQATLGGSADSMAEGLFSVIKQNTGDFRGGDESYSVLRKIAEKYNFNERDDVLAFIEELHDKISETAKQAGNGGVGIHSILRTGRFAQEVYDMIFSLSFLEPRYSLLFQDTQIEQLSPGQRGALLLIFYLLVDKGRNPIVLDQPEENLDNETVVRLLAPVLAEAKKKRQIILVTHNPNLAVYCDAEQIIYSEFDRTNSKKITYSSGSIENPVINTHVVDVLEGTMPAFNNRRIKYYK